MNLETIATVIVGLMIGVDLALLQRSNARLRKQLLELATERAKTKSAHEIQILCDNSQAIASLEEVGRVIAKTTEQLNEIERRKPLH